MGRMDGPLDTQRLLLECIKKRCATDGMSEREFGYAAVQDGRFVERLRAGKATIKVIKRAEAFLNAGPVSASAVAA